MKFIFDLDGTLSCCETLPIIAKSFNVTTQIEELTAQTINGQIPFMESFIKRVDILGHLDVAQVARIVADIPLNQSLLDFINSNRDDCIIATGNYNGWIAELAKKIECVIRSSEGEVDANGKVRLTKILKKEDIVKEYQAQGEQVVFIGDGNNDAEAMRIADVSIACGLIHQPANTVMQVADYAVYDSVAMLRLLQQIKSPQNGRSVVISAAGVGSRLGLGQTKSLIKLQGVPLIHLQLEQFRHVSDLRIVVGFQASSLIDEVCSIRKDIIFVFNHDYFHSKTGASLYLGGKHANEMIIAWDGDLLVHPDDIVQCIEAEQEFIGVSQKVSEDAVFVKLNEQEQVVSFSRDDGDYEWSGPAAIRRENIRFTSGHLYNLLEPLLPMSAKIIRAQDIDTYEDYKKAVDFVDSWSSGNHKINSYYEKLASKIKSPIETRNKAPDFSIFDIELVKRFSDKSKTLLDLGAGTGLLVNHLTEDFSKIVAVEKYSNFSDFIKRTDNLKVINEDLNIFDVAEKFDLVTIFGVMNFFNRTEAERIYQKARSWIRPAGTLIVKHQMGCTEDVIVDGYSKELGTDYYSEYRWLQHEIDLIRQAGFSIKEVVDIYPKEYNRWDNTHFYALVCIPEESS